MRHLSKEKLSTVIRKNSQGVIKIVLSLRFPFPLLKVTTISFRTFEIFTWESFLRIKLQFPVTFRFEHLTLSKTCFLIFKACDPDLLTA